MTNIGTQRSQARAPHQQGRYTCHKLTRRELPCTDDVHAPNIGKRRRAFRREIQELAVVVGDAVDVDKVQTDVLGARALRKEPQANVSVAAVLAVHA